MNLTAHPTTASGPHRYLPEAREISRRIVRARHQRKLEPAFSWFVLAETPQGAVWVTLAFRQGAKHYVQSKYSS